MNCMALELKFMNIVCVHCTIIIIPQVYKIDEMGFIYIGVWNDEMELVLCHQHWQIQVACVEFKVWFDITKKENEKIKTFNQSKKHHLFLYLKCFMQIINLICLFLIIIANCCNKHWINVYCCFCINFTTSSAYYDMDHR